MIRVINFEDRYYLEHPDARISGSRMLYLGLLCHFSTIQPSRVCKVLSFQNNACNRDYHIDDYRGACVVITNRDGRAVCKRHLKFRALVLSVDREGDTRPRVDRFYPARSLHTGDSIEMRETKVTATVQRALGMSNLHTQRERWSNRAWVTSNEYCEEGERKEEEELARRTMKRATKRDTKEILLLAWNTFSYETSSSTLCGKCGNQSLEQLQSNVQIFRIKFHFWEAPRYRSRIDWVVHALCCKIIVSLRLYVKGIVADNGPKLKYY